MNKKKYRINGKTMTAEKASKFLATLFMNENIMFNGGYLFKTSIRNENLYLDILPSYRYGEREYHYNLKPPVESPVLVGTIDTQYQLSLIIKEKNWNTELRPIYRSLILRTITLFGLSDADRLLQLDFVTRNVLISCFGKDPGEGNLRVLMNYFPD